jgi:hypothetical protein
MAMPPTIVVAVTAAATTTTSTTASTTSTTSATFATFATFTASAAAATSTTAAAAAAHRYLREAAGPVFLVEDVECSKTHVGYFLFAKNEALIGCGAQRLRKVRSRKSGCGCASHQRKTQSGCA